MDQLAEPPLAFFLARPAGDLLARYDSNRSLLHTLTAATLSWLLDGAFVLFYLVLLVAYSPWLAALVVLLVALQVLSFVAFGTRYRERMSAELEAEARTEAHLVDMLSGIETLKASGSETRFLERWTHLFVRELNASVLRNRLRAVAGAVTSGLSILSPLAVVFMGYLDRIFAGGHQARFR